MARNYDECSTIFLSKKEAKFLKMVLIKGMTEGIWALLGFIDPNDIDIACGLVVSLSTFIEEVNDRKQRNTELDH